MRWNNLTSLILHTLWIPSLLYNRGRCCRAIANHALLFKHTDSRHLVGVQASTEGKVWLKIQAASCLKQSPPGAAAAAHHGAGHADPPQLDQRPALSDQPCWIHKFLNIKKGIGVSGGWQGFLCFNRH